MLNDVAALAQHSSARPDDGRPALLRVSDRAGPCGFGCANRAELEAPAKRLAELGVEHGGIVDESYASGLSFRDRDGIALEFFALPEDRSR